MGLRRQAWWLLVVSGVFALSVGLSNTFVNVYLWKVDRTYVAIGWYNLAVYAFLPAAFVVAGWLAARLHVVWTLRIGLALHAAFYAIAWAGGTQVASWPVLLGAIMGTAAGFYWFSFNILSLKLTQTGEREKFYGLNGVAGALAGMIAPPTAGFLISYEDRMGGLSGYHLIFGLSLGMFALAGFLSTCIQTKDIVIHPRFVRAWQALSVQPWRMVMVGCVVYGLREGVFLFLIGLLLYVATGSELQLGNFVLLQSALSFISFYVVGRLVKPHNRLPYMLAGSLCMAAAALLFQLPVQPRVIVWYGCAIALVLPLFLIPLQGLVFDGINRLDPSGAAAADHIISREAFENLGRVIGIAAFLILAAARPDVRQVANFATGLGFVQIGTWLLVKAGKSAQFASANGVQGKKRVFTHPDHPWKENEDNARQRLRGLSKVR